MNVIWKSYEIAKNWNDTSEKILLIFPLARARFWKKEKKRIINLLQWKPKGLDDAYFGDRSVNKKTDATHVTVGYSTIAITFNSEAILRLFLHTYT